MRTSAALGDISTVASAGRFTVVRTVMFLVMYVHVFSRCKHQKTFICRLFALFLIAARYWVVQSGLALVSCYRGGSCVCRC